MESYFRKGFVANAPCYGDEFLDEELYYPSFRMIQATDTEASLARIEQATQHFSWLPLAQGLGSAFVSSATTLFVFWWTGKREKEKSAPPRIVRAP